MIFQFLIDYHKKIQPIQDRCIQGIIYVHCTVESNEREIYTLKHKEINFQSLIYTIYLREMSNNLLCECMRVCRFVWGCIIMWLKRGM